MGPIQSYRSFWRLSFQLGGRTSRSEYFFAIAIQSLIMVGCVSFLFALASWQYNWKIPIKDYRKVSGVVNVVVMTIFAIPSYIPMFSMMIRRTRDAGLPPSLAAISLIPAFGYLWMLILYFVPSKDPLPPANI